MHTPYDAGLPQQLQKIIDRLTSGNVSALADLVGAEGLLPYFTGAGQMATTSLTAFARTLLDDADEATARNTIGLNALGIGASAPSDLANANDAQMGSMLRMGGTESQAAAANLPILGGDGNLPRWWNVLTFGSPNRATQIAQEVYGQGNTPKGRVFVRVNHDTWQLWQEIYTARDETSRLLRSWNSDELANASVLLFDLPAGYAAFEVVMIGLYSSSGSVISMRLGSASSAGQEHGLHASSNYESSLMQTSGDGVTAVNATATEFAIGLTRALGDNVSRTLITPGSGNNHPTMNVNFAAGTGSSFFISTRAGRLMVPERMTRIGIISTAGLSAVGNIRLYGVN